MDRAWGPETVGLWEGAESRATLGFLAWDTGGMLEHGTSIGRARMETAASERRHLGCKLYVGLGQTWEVNGALGVVAETTEARGLVEEGSRLGPEMGCAGPQGTSHRCAGAIVSEA